MQERFRRYFGIEPTHIAAVRNLARELQADVVVAVGLEVLPYLTGVRGSRRVWYAADEWLWHHVSQVKLTDLRSWHHVTDGVIKGLYERAYCGVVDVTWVVSDADRRAMQSVAGMRVVAVVPNGVDTDLFQPQQVREVPNSVVFWGRLDFGPNVDALMWFSREIWTELRRFQPDATFTIIGYEPSEQVLQLARQDGIEVKPNVVDLRIEACRHAVTVLPFVSGGGIKNKLLEAAALQRPIVCSPTAARGLSYGAAVPFVLASSRSEWINVIRRLWADQSARKHLGEAARAWVRAHHSWAAAATIAVNSLRSPQHRHDAAPTQPGISS
jgi:glycosyltransferase involved in cell wall biosynthesis